MDEKPKARSPETASQMTALKTKAPKAAPKRATPPIPSRKAPAETKTAPRKPETVHKVTPEERWHMVAEAAYYIAEKRGFGFGHPVDDWVAAEA
jgi:hypothetical protein